MSVPNGWDHGIFFFDSSIRYKEITETPYTCEEKMNNSLV